jgi:hypothetical protein
VPLGLPGTASPCPGLMGSQSQPMLKPQCCGSGCRQHFWQAGSAGYVPHISCETLGLWPVAGVVLMTLISLKYARV